MSSQLLVEIIAYAPTAFYHCTHCEVAWKEAGVSNRIHLEQYESSLPDDLTQQYQVISDWVKAIFSQHGDKILVKMIDAASIEGFFKSLTYGVRKYPAVILDRHNKYQYSQLETATGAIDHMLV